jgi:hypoxanthine phosphoribosyltransferase
MAKKLKGVIIGITNVITVDGRFDNVKFDEVGHLIRFLLSKKIQPVIFSNRQWVLSSNGKKNDLEKLIKDRWGTFPYINALRDGTPPKPRSEATEYITKRFGWDPSEVVYIGNTVNDMQTAVNGKLLFLNVTWFGQNTDYGFFFNSPLDVARFIDTFCLRDSSWHYSIEKDDLRFYALAPYSTRISDFKFLSDDAKSAAKWGGGHPDFWTKYLWSTIYFSEVYKDINYIAVIPGHRQGSGNRIMEEPMSVFAKCFRQSFLSNLIFRHTTIEASHKLRISKMPVNHYRQLSSIMLNQFPLRQPGQAYKKCPVTSGKTVLVIDDICTSGYTLEAARAYIKQTGARVLCMSWLKTINTPYEQIIDTNLSFNPFRKSEFTLDFEKRVHNYDSLISDERASEEVTQKLQAYDSWQWPKNI